MMVSRDKEVGFFTTETGPRRGSRVLRLGGTGEDAEAEGARGGLRVGAELGGQREEGARDGPRWQAKWEGHDLYVDVIKRKVL